MWISGLALKPGVTTAKLPALADPLSACGVVGTLLLTEAGPPTFTPGSPGIPYPSDDLAVSPPLVYTPGSPLMPYASRVVEVPIRAKLHVSISGTAEVDPRQAVDTASCAAALTVGVAAGVNAASRI